MPGCPADWWRPFHALFLGRAMSRCHEYSQHHREGSVFVGVQWRGEAAAAAAAICQQAASPSIVSGRLFPSD